MENKRRYSNKFLKNASKQVLRSIVKKLQNEIEEHEKRTQAIKEERNLYYKRFFDIKNKYEGESKNDKKG